MAAMHYDGNFNAERASLNSKKDVISKELASMEETIEGMTYWKDEKSEEFKASAKELIKKLKTENENANAEGNKILSQVEAALRIYE